MILLNYVVPILVGPYPNTAWHGSCLLHFRHGSMRRRVGIQGDHSERSIVLHRLAEEAFGRHRVALLAQQKIDGPTLLVDRPVEIGPAALHLDVCLITAPRAADRTSITLPELFEFWHVTLHPAQNRGVGQRDITFAHDLHKVARTELETQMPTHAMHNDLWVELPAFEQIR